MIWLGLFLAFAIVAIIIACCQQAQAEDDENQAKLHRAFRDARARENQL